MKNVSLKNVKFIFFVSDKYLVHGIWLFFQARTWYRRIRVLYDLTAYYHSTHTCYTRFSDEYKKYTPKEKKSPLECSRFYYLFYLFEQFCDCGRNFHVFFVTFANCFCAVFRQNAPTVYAVFTLRPVDLRGGELHSVRVPKNAKRTGGLHNSLAVRLRNAAAFTQTNIGVGNCAVIKHTTY